MSSSLDREPKRKRNPWLVRGGAAVAFGAVSLIGGVACDDENRAETPTATATAQLPLESISQSEEAIADLYQMSDDLTSQYFKERRSGITIGGKRSLSYGLTHAKADFIYTANLDLLEQNFSIKRFEDTTIIVIQDRAFDISNNSADFVIGTALIDYLFQQQFADELRQEFQSFNYDRQTLDDIDNLLWLKDNFEKIELGDLPPIARTANLEELAIGLKALQEAGLPIPKKARIGNFNYSDSNNPYEGEDEETIFLDVWDYPTGEFRAESAIAEFTIANNPQILEGYSQVVTAAFDQYEDQITEPMLLSSGDYGYLGDDASEFSSFFADYIFDGVSLRKRIAYVKATGHLAEAAILEVKASYVRQLLGGRDYSVDGGTKEIREYKIGDIIEIVDYEAPRDPGIYLRSGPVLEIDPNWPSVRDGSKVRLIGGPTVVLDHDYHEATTFWQVEEGSIVNQRLWLRDPQYDNDGDVSEEWFGPQIKIGQ